jgi:hypothetical protein
MAKESQNLVIDIGLLSSLPQEAFSQDFSTKYFFDWNGRHTVND